MKLQFKQTVQANVAIRPMTNRKLHMRFRLTQLSMTWVRIFSECQVISHICEASTAKRMKIDPYCQRQNCDPLSVLFSDMVFRNNDA